MKRIISVIAITAIISTAFAGCDDIQDTVISTSMNDSSFTDTLQPTDTSTTDISETTITDSQQANSETDTSIDTSATENSSKASVPAPTVSMAINESIPENDAVIQIPVFNADSNAGVDSINSRIQNDLKSVYNTHLADVAENGENAGWIDIKSYEFTSGNYVQVISLLAEFPSYGTDGKIFSYNYDVLNATSLSLETIMNKFAVTQYDLEAAMATAFKPESETRKLVSVEPAAFRIGEDGTADIYIYVYSDDPNSTPDTRIWIYNSQSKVCSQYDKNRTFNQ